MCKPSSSPRWRVGLHGDCHYVSLHEHVEKWLVVVRQPVHFCSGGSQLLCSPCPGAKGIACTLLWTGRLHQTPKEGVSCMGRSQVAFQPTVVLMSAEEGAGACAGLAFSRQGYPGGNPKHPWTLSPCWYKSSQWMFLDPGCRSIKDHSSHCHDNLN